MNESTDENGITTYELTDLFDVTKKSAADEIRALFTKHQLQHLGAYEDGVICCYDCHGNGTHSRCELCMEYVNNDGPEPCDVIRALRLQAQDTVDRLTEELTASQKHRDRELKRIDDFIEVLKGYGVEPPYELDFGNHTLAVGHVIGTENALRIAQQKLEELT